MVDCDDMGHFEGYIKIKIKELEDLEALAKEYERKAQSLFDQGKKIAADEMLKKRAKLLKRIVKQKARFEKI